MAKEEYHTDKYALEVVRIATGQRVRFMEIFGENAAKATLDIMTKYWNTRPEYRPEMKQVRNAQGSME